VNRQEQLIQTIEITSFLKVLKKNTNICIPKNEFEQLFYLKDTVLPAFRHNLNYSIFGVDIAKGFSINLGSLEDLKFFGQQLWEHPENYYELPDHIYCYDHFLGYLWVKTPYGKEIRLFNFLDEPKNV